MNQPAYHEITACRLCGGGELIESLNIGTQALSGRFPGPSLERGVNLFPLCLGWKSYDRFS